MRQLDKVLTTSGTLLSEDYAPSSAAQNYLHALRHYLLGIRNGGTLSHHSLSVLQCTSRHNLLAHQLETSHHAIHFGSKLPLQILSELFSLNHAQPAATNGPQNSNREPSHDDRIENKTSHFAYQPHLVLQIGNIIFFQDKETWLET